jgi:glycosyltransferase involved in cell wall biosynthesis
LTEKGIKWEEKNLIDPYATQSQQVQCTKCAGAPLGKSSFMTDNPRISIIIPNKNYGAFLEETLLSIIEQAYTNTEIILIDSCSTDDSLTVIRQYQHHLTYWVSEPDCGQADAINKGVVMATGDLVIWMNSDDRFAPHALKNVADAYRQTPNAAVYCGYLTHFGERGVKEPARMKTFSSLERTLVFGSMSSASMYFKRDKFLEAGPLEQRLHYCFDLEFWCRFIEIHGQECIHFMEQNLAFFRLHPQSKTISSFEKFGEEHYLIMYSILKSFKHYSHQSPAPEALNIAGHHERSWRFSGVNPRRLDAWLIQFMLERFHARLRLSIILRWYGRSLALAPANRGLRFYWVPLRAIRWKMLSRAGTYKTWVDDYRKNAK